MKMEDRSRVWLDATWFYQSRSAMHDRRIDEQAEAQLCVVRTTLRCDRVYLIDGEYAEGFCHKQSKQCKRTCDTYAWKGEVDNT